MGLITLIVVVGFVWVFVFGGWVVGLFRSWVGCGLMLADLFAFDLLESCFFLWFGLLVCLFVLVYLPLVLFIVLRLFVCLFGFNTCGFVWCMYCV